MSGREACPAFFRIPTAHTSWGPTAVTACSTFTSVPGLGVGTTTQRCPFQCSARVFGDSYQSCLPIAVPPTAQMSSRDTTATPCRTDPRATPLGWRTGCHPLPLLWTMNARGRWLGGGLVDASNPPPTGCRDRRRRWPRADLVERKAGGDASPSLAVPVLDQVPAEPPADRPGIGWTKNLDIACAPTIGAGSRRFDLPRGAVPVPEQRLDTTGLQVRPHDPNVVGSGPADVRKVRPVSDRSRESAKLAVTPRACTAQIDAHPGRCTVGRHTHHRDLRGYHDQCERRNPSAHYGHLHLGSVPGPDNRRTVVASSLASAGPAP